MSDWRKAYQQYVGPLPTSLAELEAQEAADAEDVDRDLDLDGP